MVQPLWLQVAGAGLLGLLVGSFLNVVIHRLPIMMRRQWQLQCAELAGEQPPDAPRFDLVTPRSRCPHCDRPIAWHENIPVLSYLLLGGRCAGCRQRISARYPLVELLTGALFAWCGWQWGWTAPAAAWALFAALLIAAGAIDFDTTLLPDDLTLPLLWAGLLAAATGWSGVALDAAVWGAACGYLALWSIYWAFKVITGKEGMGYGDFKLLAALGAWFGWQGLIPIALLASVLGAVVGIGLKLARALGADGLLPFGPFLALAGIVSMLFGPQTIVRAVGLS